MMRAWGNRPDAVVIDEPLYAYYLDATRKDHPGAAEIIAHGQRDWHKVVTQLSASPLPGGKSIFYQKQMTHHLLPEVDRGWIAKLTNCFLIRDPREVILSYIKVNPKPTLEDLGFVQQLEIFSFVRDRTRAIPPVCDAKDILENPERLLRLLCATIGVNFQVEMLSWPPGLRETDGIWAKYWYDDVARSTSFKHYQSREGVIPDHLREIHDRCRKCYDELHQHRLR
jgi:Sulfotransferase domain